MESSRDSDSSNEVYNINNNSNSIESKNRDFNISDSDNNSVNFSNFLNNECVNIYVTWHWLYNFILGWKDADVIDLNYKKECNVFV